MREVKWPLGATPYSLNNPGFFSMLFCMILCISISYSTHLFSDSHFLFPVPGFFGGGLAHYDPDQSLTKIGPAMWEITDYTQYVL